MSATEWPLVAMFAEALGAILLAAEFWWPTPRTIEPGRSLSVLLLELGKACSTKDAKERDAALSMVREDVAEYQAVECSTAAAECQSRWRMRIAGRVGLLLLAAGATGQLVLALLGASAHAPAGGG